MDFATLLENHDFHLKIIFLLMAIIGATFAIIRAMFRHSERRMDEMRDTFNEIKADNKNMARDVSELKNRVVQYVTREEFSKSMERVHARIDGQERVLLGHIQAGGQESSEKAI